MKAWLFGGRASGTQYRVHMNKNTAALISEALWHYYAIGGVEECRKTYQDFEKAKEKALKIRLRDDK